MQKFIICTGKTEDGAIAAGLEELGLAREEVSVEVLELAKRGFLGIGGTDAKVKLTYEVPDEPAPQPEKPAQPEPVVVAKPEKIVYEAPKEETPKAKEQVRRPKVKEAPVKKEPPVKKEAVAAAPAPEGDEKAERIVDFLTGLLDKMGVEATPKITVDAEGNYQVELVGEDLGAVIGRRGETLDAIQQLTGYAVNKGENHRVRVRVDAEGYRSKREESLERMANRVADKVLRYRRNVTLEPMNAYERHVIHTALQDRKDITTYSIGTEPNRRTVVAYAPGEHR